MRRLVVELYGKELDKRLEGTPFEKIKSMEMVHLLRNDQSENVSIWRVRLRDPGLKVEDCFKKDGVTKEVQVLEREEKGEGADGPSYLVFLRRTVRPGLLLGHGTDPEGGYLQGPMELRDGRIRFSFVGSQKQVKAILDGAEQRGLRYRVVLMTDADFAEDSLLHRLTEKQRRILIMAYKLGYFDVPKKINSDELGDRLKLSGSTVVEHLGKAERRLLDGILSES
jgi:DNA-binding CsgD family transcriptional regulator